MCLIRPPKGKPALQRTSHQLTQLHTHAHISSLPYNDVGVCVCVGICVNVTHFLRFTATIEKQLLNVKSNWLWVCLCAHGGMVWVLLEGLSVSNVNSISSVWTKSLQCWNRSTYKRSRGWETETVSVTGESEGHLSFLSVYISVFRICLTGLSSIYYLFWSVSILVVVFK